jgi:hypothetical protein
MHVLWLMSVIAYTSACQQAPAIAEEPQLVDSLPLVVLYNGWQTVCPLQLLMICIVPACSEVIDLVNVHAQHLHLSECIQIHMDPYANCTLPPADA